MRCRSGHFNHPASRACSRCGSSLDGQPPASGPRPPLGVLIADDGFVYRIDGDLVAGSHPDGDPAVVAGRAAPLHLSGPGDSVAPAHAEIRLSDWSAAVIDRGSAAGTFVVAPGETGWTRLAPFQPTPLRPGSHLSLGQRVLTYVSPWPPTP